MYKYRKVQKSKAAAVGFAAFLLAPFGFGLSMIVGASAAIVTAAYDCMEADKENSIEEIMGKPEFRETAEPATLVGLCGIIIAMPNPFGLVGIVAKVAAMIAVRHGWWKIIKLGGTEPNFKEHWEFVFRRDDQVVRFKF